MSAVSQTARLAPLRAPASNKRAERRGARAMRVVAHANSESDDTPRVSRRLLGIGSAALSAAFAKGLTFPTPAEAKKIVSGYTPLDGYDVRPPPTTPPPATPMPRAIPTDKKNPSRPEKINNARNSGRSSRDGQTRLLAGRPPPPLDPRPLTLRPSLPLPFSV